MHVLLTNDDGIDAPGLAALERAIRSALPDGFRLSVVAPDRQRSECGHAVTLRRPVRTRCHNPQRWSLDGTPVDCVRLALEHLTTDVDLVFSGVNEGGNLGADLLVSGTFAAAKEAFLRGVPAVAFSHYRHPQIPREWDHVPRWINRLIQQAVRDCKNGLFLRNINLPADHRQALPKIASCPIDPSPMGTRYEPVQSDQYVLRMDYQRRPRQPGTDVDLCFSGCMTVTEVETRSRNLTETELPVTLETKSED